MSIWHIAWGYLWNRKLTTCLTILSVALGVALIYSVLNLREETRKRFEEEGQAYDIVAGGAGYGSPLQLVLSAVYFMDRPTGNMDYAEYELLRDHEDVQYAFPIGLGDTYRGSRIVGTVRELFDYAWTNPLTNETRRPFQLAEGRFFERNQEAVLGSVVAKQTGLQLGDTFVGAHGFVEGAGHVHDNYPYEVVGILKTSGTPNDRCIFTTLESVWEVHGHKHDHVNVHQGKHDDAEHAEPEAAHSHEDHDEHAHEDHADTPNPGAESAAAGHTHGEADSEEGDRELEVTAVLIQLQSPALRWQFREFVNEDLKAMAAIPIEEVSKLYQQVLGLAKSVLLAVGYLVVVISAISILIGLYLSILQRKRDLAIMRALGASAYEIVGSILVEALLVTLLGVGAGWLIGNGVCWGVGLYLIDRYGLSVGLFGLTSEELTAFATVALVGMVAGILPAYQAYRTDVARDLAEL